MREYSKMNRTWMHILAALCTVAGCLLCGGMAAGTVADHLQTEAEGESEWMSEWISENMGDLWKEGGTEEEGESEVLDEGISEDGKESECEEETTEEIDEENSESEEASEGFWEAETEVESETEEMEDAESEEDTTEEIDEENSESEEVSEGFWEAETEVESETEEMEDAESEEETTEEIDEENSESEEVSEGSGEAGMERESEVNRDTGKTDGVEDTESGSEKVSESSGETGTEPGNEAEKEPESILRGVHYNVTGDQGAYWRDENDRLWLKKGTALYIQPTDGSVYNKGNSLEAAEQDGSLEFRLKMIGENGTVLQESATAWETYYVDGEAPGAVINAEGVLENSILYSASETAAQIWIEPDGKSGLKRAAYCIIPCTPDGAWQYRPDECTWYECGNGQTVVLQEEGVFQIYVRTEDQVGNLAFSGSLPIGIDRTAPEITVEGVQNHTANNGQLAIRVSCRDENYRNGSMRVSLTGFNQGKNPVIQSQQEQADGAFVLYYDFPTEKYYDDVYQLKISAEDKAGNCSEEIMEFSVNRFGSVYDLSEATRELLSQFYLSVPEDIVFYETNIDYVGTSEIYCRCDGTLRTLEQGSDYQVTMQGTDNTWKQYQYTIPASCFSQEGVYELMLTSGDQASNVSDTGMQEKRVVFAVDQTSPGCTLSGVSGGSIYEKEEMTAYITPYDNMGLSMLRVYCNSQMILEETGPQSDQTISLSLKESEKWQTLQVYVSDLAGNQYWMDEVPVYISQETEEVPEYQKPEISARESEEMKNSADTALETGNLSKKEQKATEETEGSETAESSEHYELPIGKKDDSGSEKFMERITKQPALRFFWPIGTAVFLLTVVVCTLAGSKRKH